MKILTIGSTTLELESFQKNRDKVVGVYAEIKIPTTAISRDDLNALFIDNQHDLIVTEEDGSTTTYSGYSLWEETREKKDFYTVIQICTSETMHLLNEARKQISTLEREKTELQREIKVHKQALINHNAVIVEQREQLAKQAETIETQTEEIAMLNDTLLEMLMA